MSANDADSAVVEVAQLEAVVGSTQQPLSAEKEGAVNGSGNMHASESRPKDGLVDSVPSNDIEIPNKTGISYCEVQPSSLEKEDMDSVPVTNDTTISKTGVADLLPNDTTLIIQVTEEHSDIKKGIDILDEQETAPAVSQGIPDTIESKGAPEPEEKKEDMKVEDVHPPPATKKADVNQEWNAEDNEAIIQVEAPSNTTHPATEAPSLPGQSSDPLTPVTQAGFDPQPASVSEATKIESDTSVSEVRPGVAADDDQPAPPSTTEAKNDEHISADNSRLPAVVAEPASNAVNPEQVEKSAMPAEDAQDGPGPDPDSPATLPITQRLDTIPPTQVGTTDKAESAPEAASNNEVVAEVTASNEVEPTVQPVEEPEAAPQVDAEVPLQQVQEELLAEPVVVATSVPSEETEEETAKIPEPALEGVTEEKGSATASAPESEPSSAPDQVTEAVVAPPLVGTVLANSETKDTEVGYVVADEEVAPELVKEAEESVQESTIASTIIEGVVPTASELIVPLLKESKEDDAQTPASSEEKVVDSEVGHAVTNEEVVAQQVVDPVEAPQEDRDDAVEVPNVAKAAPVVSTAIQELEKTSVEPAEPEAPSVSTSEPVAVVPRAVSPTPATSSAPKAEAIVDDVNRAANETEAESTPIIEPSESPVHEEVAEPTHEQHDEQVPIAVAEVAESEPTLATSATQPEAEEVDGAKELEAKDAEELAKSTVEESIPKEVVITPTPEDSAQVVPAHVEQEAPESESFIVAPAKANDVEEITPSEPVQTTDAVSMSTKAEEAEHPAPPQESEPKESIEAMVTPAGTQAVEEQNAEPAVTKGPEVPLKQPEVEVAANKAETVLTQEAPVLDEESIEVAKDPEVVEPVPLKETTEEVVEPTTVDSTIGSSVKEPAQQLASEEVKETEETEKNLESEPRVEVTPTSDEATKVPVVTGPDAVSGSTRAATGPVVEPGPVVEFEEPSAAAVADTNLQVPEETINSAHTEEPKVESTWIPSFHVTTQGPSDTLTVHDEPKSIEEPAIVEAPQARNVEVEEGETSTKPDNEPAQVDSPQVSADSSNEGSSEPPRPWTPSYSVHSQGSPRPSFSLPAEEAADKKPAWTRSYSVHSQGSSPLLSPAVLLSEPAQLELQGSAIETEDKDKDTLGPARSYSVHSQGNSPLLAPVTQADEPTTLDLQEPSPAVEPVSSDQPVLIETESKTLAQEEKVHEPPTEAAAKVEEARVSTPKLVINDGNDEAVPDIQEPAELKPSLPHIDRPASPSWVPSYSVDRQGSQADEPSGPLAEVAAKKAAGPTQPDVPSVDVKEEHVEEEQEEARQQSTIPRIQIQDEQTASKELKPADHTEDEERSTSPSTWTPSYSVTTVGSPPQNDVTSDKFEPLPVHTLESSAATTDTAASAHDTASQPPESKEVDLTKEHSTPSDNKVPFVVITDSLVETFPETGESQNQKPIGLTVLMEEPASPEALSPATTRTRHESIASSRFFPGGWFSPRSEGRTSLENAHGEFSSAKSRVSSDDVPDSPSDMEDDHSSHSSETVQPVKEEKSRWCVVM